jgi:hypothetical protein
MNWSRYHWNVCFSFNSDWLSVFTVFKFSWYVIFSIDCYYWSRLLTYFLDFMLKDWSISFRNNFERNICFRSNFKCLYFFILIDFNFSFDCCRIFDLMNWNIDSATDQNLFMSFISNWLVKFSININSSLFNCFFISSNRFIYKDWLIYFWHTFQWNIISFSNLYNIYLSISIVCLNGRFNFNI